MSDSVTILRTLSPSLLATKVWKKVAGKVVAEHYGRAKHFACASEPVSSLDDLTAVLKIIEGDTRASVIRAERLRNKDPKKVNRKVHGPDACFEPKNWQKLAIDIDTLELPTHLTDFNSESDNVIQHAVSFLPSEFHDVDCFWQFSSSMGMKDGIRVHLWYWLDTAISEREIKTWLAGYPVDLMLYNPVQPHYVAAPVFADGIKDPVSKRSGIFRFGKSNDTVAVPADRQGRVRSTQTTVHSILAAHGGGPSEVVFDSAGFVKDGRDWWLFLKTMEACEALIADGLTAKDLTAPEIAN